MPDLAEQLRAEAFRLEFDSCGITSADPPASAPLFLQAIQQGRHAGMEWLARNAEKRCDPQRILPGARSIVCLAVAYHGPDATPPPTTQAQPQAHSAPTGLVARYARYPDYHVLIGSRLATLTQWLDTVARPAHRSLWYIDTGPILERDLAQRAGLGFVGRHTNLVSRSLGNWFFIAEILTQVELPADPPGRNLCGRCTRCLDACPTGALPAPFTLDARRCVSYQTIENKGSIPEDLRPGIGTRIYGCDDCLAACPWNRFAKESRLLRQQHRTDLVAPGLVELLSLDDTAFRTRFRDSPILRTKRRGFLRNVAVALGNCGGHEALMPLSKACADPEPLVREHADWALRQVEQRIRSGPRATSMPPPRHTVPTTPQAPPA